MSRSGVEAGVGLMRRMKIWCLDPTEDATSPASALALTLMPLTPETMETSRDVLVPSLALTMPVFASDPSFASAATFLVGAINASCTGIIMALGPSAELGVPVGINAFAWALATIGYGGAGTSDAAVIDVGAMVRISTHVFLCAG